MTRQRTPLRAADILPSLYRSLPPHAAALLASISEEARNAGLALYLVGGPVRDLLLERPVKDLDLVVEGDAQALASTIATKLNGKLLSRSQFGTAAVRFGDQRLDLVTARREMYSRPGALPRVTPSSIADDLARRDFSINSMAIPLSGTGRGDVLDPHGGRKDLASGLVRTLHELSFVDDPTRVLRAVRYEQRLDFRLEDRTERRLVEALDDGTMDTLSADRLRRELAVMLGETEPHRALRRGAELGVLTAVHPALGDDSAVAALAKSCGNYSPLEYLAALSFPLSPEDGMSLAHRLRMPATWERVLTNTIAVRRNVAPDIARRPELKGSALYRVLEPYVHEALQMNALMAKTTFVRKAMDSYLADMRYVNPILRGGDLASIGLPRGPLVGDVLRELRSARLDGLVTTRDDEIRFARDYVASRRTS